MADYGSMMKLLWSPDTSTDTQPMTEILKEKNLRDLLGHGEFVLTAEITPPLSASADDMLRTADQLGDAVDAINVTDGASARVHMSSIAAAMLLKRSGIEPIVQITCRDRNRIALQGDLLGAAALGVENILVLGGDQVAAGDHPEAKPVFDLSSQELLAILHAMAERGEIRSGRKIDTPPRFFLGAADTVIDPPPGWQAEKLSAKADAGAAFVQTQFCYDAELLRRYMRRLEDLGLTERLHFLIGVGPLRSVKSAIWMRDTLHGTAMPDEVIQRLDQAADPQAEGIRICADLLQQFQETPGVAGAHLMAPRNHAAIPQSIHASGVLSGRQTSKFRSG